MRQIKFRGLRTDGQGWVYGMLVYSFEGTHILESEYFKPSNGDSPELVDVVDESVGQFTGLKDNNGVYIYEGDRCKVTYYNHIEKNSEIIQDVVSVDGGFALLKVGSNTIENLIEDDRTFVPLYYSQRPNSIEVIGNIHTQDGGKDV